MTIFATEDPSVATPANGITSDEAYPTWITENTKKEWGERLIVPELEDDAFAYRGKNGWQGKDLIHDISAPVRIREYWVKWGQGQGIEGFSKGGVGTVLTGVVVYTERAESHIGYCHGGSMCSVLDDVIGWCAFLTTGKCVPWSGFTVQINTSLKKPIKVKSTLLVRGVIKSIERRKVSVEAELINPATGNTIHASGIGLVVLNHGILPPSSRDSIVSSVSDI